MKTMNKVIMILGSSKRMVLMAFVMLWAFQSKAQQIPLYASYMINPYLISPSHAGSGMEDARLFAISRLQLVGIDGAPVTFMASGDAPIKKYNMGLGASIFTDKYGLLRNTGFGIGYSYKLKLGDDFKIHLGISGEVSQLALDFDAIKAADLEENIIQSSAQKLLFNGAAGLHMEYKDFILGFASPQVYGSRVAFQNYVSNSEVNYQTERHYLGWMTYRFPVKYNVFDLEPTVLMRTLPGTSPQFDVNLRGIIKDQVFMSVGLRSGYAFSAGVGAYVGPNLTIAYSTDMAITDVRGSTWGGHEFTLGYRYFKSLDRREVDKLVEEKQEEERRKADELYGEKLDKMEDKVGELEEMNRLQKEEIDKMQAIMEKYGVELDSLRQANKDKFYKNQGGYDVNGDGVIDSKDDTNGDGTIDEKDFLSNGGETPKYIGPGSGGSTGGTGGISAGGNQDWSNRSHGKYVVVIASFKQQALAIEHQQMLKRKGETDPTYLTRSQSGTWYFVFKKSFMDPAKAKEYNNSLSKDGLPEFMYPWIYVFD